jgi:hypothetical protein
VTTPEVVRHDEGGAIGACGQEDAAGSAGWQRRPVRPPQADALAVEAADVMEKQRVTSVLVVDDTGRLVDPGEDHLVQIGDRPVRLGHAVAGVER